MKKSILIFVLLISGLIQAQDNGIIEGIVLDKQMNNEPLAFANITLKEAKLNTTANIDGAFIFEIKEGIYTLIFNFPGYQKVEIKNVVVSTGKITSIKDVIIAARKLPILAENTTKTDKK